MCFEGESALRHVSCRFAWRGSLRISEERSCQMRCVLSHIRFLLLAGVFAAVGLSQTAQLTGTVSDSTGSVVPSAEVVATNIETGVARATVTNEAGNYLITALLPGRYRITAERTGFKQIKR